jgi:hypothetical protein
MAFDGRAPALLLLLTLLAMASLTFATRVAITINRQKAPASTTNHWGSSNTNTYNNNYNNNNNNNNNDDTPSSYVAPPTIPTLFRQPASPIIPPPSALLQTTGDDATNTAWQALNGRCFDLRTDEYTYELCPFQNITQQKVGRHHVVLGVWGYWNGEDAAADDAAAVAVSASRVAERPLYHRYYDGTACSSGARRRTDVFLACATDGRYAVGDVNEPNTCHCRCRNHRCFIIIHTGDFHSYNVNGHTHNARVRARTHLTYEPFYINAFIFPQTKWSCDCPRRAWATSTRRRWRRRHCDRMLSRARGSASTR